MLEKLRILITYGGLALAVLATIFVAGFLQEFAGDEIPEAARKAGVSLPLKEPRIEIRLQTMTLSLFDGETLVKRYNIGYGYKTPGRLQDREGSTPLGEYQVVAKSEREDLLTRGTRFLQIDFPSLYDAGRAFDTGVISRNDYERIESRALLEEPPPSDTPLLGPIGIQGNFFFFRDRRFTDGSVALSNGDINELYEYVPIGTPVIISM